MTTGTKRVHHLSLAVKPHTLLNHIGIRPSIQKFSARSRKHCSALNRFNSQRDNFVQIFL